MKNWTNPVAIAQQFAANEYVSACFSVLCVTPNNNAEYRYVYEDTNKNGTFEQDIDKLILDVPSIFAGCNGRHDVIIHGEVSDLKNNGFIAKHGAKYDVEPFFYWDGHVIDPSASGWVLDMHGTDLSRSDVIVPAENPNFS